MAARIRRRGEGEFISVGQKREIERWCGDILSVKRFDSIYILDMDETSEYSVHDVDEYGVLMMMNLRFSYEYKVL